MNRPCVSPGKKTCLAPVLVAALLCSAAGCAGRKSVYKDLEERRQGDATAWKEAKEHAPDGPILTGPLSLKDAVRIALDNNTTLENARNELDASRGALKEAWAAALPNVAGEGTYTRRDHEPRSLFGEEPLVTGDRDVTSAGATLQQPVFAGGAILAGIRAARLGVYRAEEGVLSVTQDVIAETRTRYYEVLLNEQLVRVSTESLEVAQAHFDNVAARKKQGAASRYDVVRSQVEVANSRAEHIQTRNRLNLSRTTFYKAVAASQKSSVTFSDPLIFKRITPAFEKSVVEALLDRPDLLQQELAVRIQREQVRIARAGWLPTVNLFGRYTWDHPATRESGNFSWDDSWEFGANMRVPFLFEGLRTKGRYDAAKAGLAGEETTLRDTVETAVMEVKQAVINLKDNEEFVESQKENIAAATEGRKLVETSYREGVATQLDVLDARIALTRAAANHFRAVHNYMLAKLLLEKATGALHPPDAPRPKRPTRPVIRVPGVLVPEDRRDAPKPNAPPEPKPEPEGKREDAAGPFAPDA